MNYGRYISADILRQLFYGRYVTADIMRQLYYGRSITANTSQQIYYGRCIMACIVRQIYFGRYTTTAIISRQMYYGIHITAYIYIYMYYSRYAMADTLWPIYYIQQKRPYLKKYPAAEAVDCGVRTCLLRPIAPRTTYKNAADIKNGPPGTGISVRWLWLSQTPHLPVI